MSAGTGKNHIIRAALEAIAYQTEDVLSAMNADMQKLGGGEEKPITCLKVDGGASSNALLMQMQSDLSAVEVLCAESPEATAMGAAFLAGLAVGFFRDREEIKCMVGQGRRFSPVLDAERRQKKLDGWHRAVKACKVFAEQAD